MNKPSLFSQFNAVITRIFQLFTHKNKKLRYSDLKGKDILSLEEAAFYLGTDSGTLLEEVCLGRLPGGQIGQKWYFSKWALVSHLSSYQSMPLDDE